MADTKSFKRQVDLTKALCDWLNSSGEPADDEPREVVRQSPLVGAGLIGGWAATYAAPLNLERRAPVWEALSELFVGKELLEYDHAAIAKTLRLSGYSVEELEEVLHKEVAPVFRRNLSPLSIPEMEGWARDTVVKEIQAYLEHERTGLLRRLSRLVTARTLPDVASKRWQRIRSLLS